MDTTEQNGSGLSGVAEETVLKLADSIGQFAASAITTVPLPEFSGLPNEDARVFIRKFKLATITFNDELRCLALNKALTGAARIWAKANIKILMKLGDWASIKKLLLERFGSPNQEARHHEKLAKLKFDPDLSSITSFIEEFSDCYRKVHHAASDADIITAIKLKLPDKVLMNLYLLDGSWTKFDSIANLLELVKRLEHDILPYSGPNTEKDNRLDLASLNKILTELKDTIKSQKQEQANNNAAANAKPNEVSLAAINHRVDMKPDYNNNVPPYGTNNYPWNDRRNYAGNPTRGYYRGGQDQRRQQNHPYSKPLLKNQEPQKSSYEDAKQAYWSRHGKPPDRVDRDRGLETPSHLIACIGASSSLIIADFIFNNSCYKAIIDTGATGSFIPSKGSIAIRNKDKLIQVNTLAKTADNSLLQINGQITIEVSPKALDVQSKEMNLLVLSERSEILGYQAIIGLDVIKAFGIRIAQVEDKMSALYHNTIIGQECSISSNSLASALAEKGDMQMEKTENANELVNEFKDIFAERAVSLMETPPMPIPLTTDSLVKAKLRRHAIEDIEEMHNQITTLLENDIIEKSQSSFSSNCHLVPKKTGQKRLVVNFIPLNAISIKDHYPMPQLSDLFSALHGARYFAALDCTEGFFQIPLLTEHRERTAFVTPHGLYHFKRCPFGYTNSPAQFQRAMNDIFQEGLYKRCVIYIDDILVFGKTSAELIDNLRWVFERCRECRVKLKQSKCKFMEEQVEFLGYTVSHNQIGPIPGKNDPLLTLTPANRIDVLTILGTLNYYARFVPDYVERTKGLRALIKKDAQFIWTSKLAEEVKKIIDDINKSTSHQIPDSHSNKSIEISVRYSSIEVTCRDTEERVISRAGMTLGQSQLAYTRVEKQLLGLILAYQKFGPFLKGKVTIRTNCKQLLSTIQLKERSERVERFLLKLPPDIRFDVELLTTQEELEVLQHSDTPPSEVFYTDGACTGNGKPTCIASWAILSTMNPSLSAAGIVDSLKPSNQVAELTAVVEACRIAKLNQLEDIVIVTDSKYAANALNKWIDTWNSNGWKDNRGKPIVNEKLLKTISDYKSKLNIKCIHVKGHSDDLKNIEVDRMARERLLKELPACLTIASTPIIDQSSDSTLKHLIEQYPSDPSIRNKFELTNGTLYYLDEKRPVTERKRLCVPESSRILLLKIAHDDPVYGGHLGNKKTLKKLSQYYWPRMVADVERYIKSCESCQKYKTPKGPRPDLLKPIKVSNIFSRLHLDIVGPIKPTNSGNRYIITAIDSFSRYAYARACQNVTTQDIIRFLKEEVMSKHGLPEVIVTDNGSQFTSHDFAKFACELNIKHSTTCAYHPAANGMDERFNGSLVKILRHYIDANQRDWDDKLIWALMLYNTSHHESTKQSPFAILYGRSPRTPLSLPDPTDEDHENTEREANYSSHGDIREVARSNMLSAQDRQKRYYDSKRKPQDFELFDLVMLRNHAPPRGDSRKLSPTWKGPYTLLKFIGPLDEPQAAVILDLNDFTTRRAPFQDLKHFHEREDTTTDKQSSTNQQTLPGVLIQSTTEQTQLDRSDSPIFAGTSSCNERRAVMAPGDRYSRRYRPAVTYGQGSETSCIELLDSPVTSAVDTAHRVEQPTISISDSDLDPANVTASDIADSNNNNHTQSAFASDRATVASSSQNQLASESVRGVLDSHVTSDPAITSRTLRCPPRTSEISHPETVSSPTEADNRGPTARTSSLLADGSQPRLSHRGPTASASSLLADGPVPLRTYRGPTAATSNLPELNEWLGCVSDPTTAQQLQQVGWEPVNPHAVAARNRSSTLQGATEVSIRQVTSNNRPRIWSAEEQRRVEVRRAELRQQELQANRDTPGINLRPRTQRIDYRDRERDRRPSGQQD